MNDTNKRNKFVLRLPQGLRTETANKARLNHRSMNSEIVYRLQHSLDQEQLLEKKDQLINQLLKRIAELELKEDTTC
ncbi:Arc family DNA-binding protein [Pseudomonas protegens]|uniref:Arc family DNA-binding protein n=1 Tax=Pseudomonas protegens TaxID=380021 RepID=UPI0037F76C9F